MLNCGMSFVGIGRCVNYAHRMRRGGGRSGGVAGGSIREVSCDLELSPPPRKRDADRGRLDSLLYGRLYLPSSTLEALYMRRLSPTQLLRLSYVSNSRLKNGGTVS